MASQSELSKRVTTAKRRVLDVIVGKPDVALRASQIFQAYTGLCGEAEFAYEDNQLDEELVGTLEEQAEKVIRAWLERNPAR